MPNKNKLNNNFDKDLVELVYIEDEKLVWLEGKLSVPHVILYDKNEDLEYLITSSCEGEMVCSDNFISNPDVSIKVICEVFKNIYKVDINDCPFNVDINYKLKLIENNVKKSLVKNENLKPETLKKYGSVENVLNYLKENNGVLPTKVEWILDEFANCPPLNAIETTVSVAVIKYDNNSL